MSDKRRGEGDQARRHPAAVHHLGDQQEHEDDQQFSAAREPHRELGVENVRTAACHHQGPRCERKVITVTALRLTASDTPSQFVQRKAQLASSWAPNREKPRTCRVKMFPAKAISAITVPAITPNRAMRSAACE
jgi:hypothetical protein